MNSISAIAIFTSNGHGGNVFRNRFRRVPRTVQMGSLKPLDLITSDIPTEITPRIVTSILWDRTTS